MAARLPCALRAGDVVLRIAHRGHAWRPVQERQQIIQRWEVVAVSCRWRGYRHAVDPPEIYLELRYLPRDQRSAVESRRTKYVSPDGVLPMLPEAV